MSYNGVGLNTVRGSGTNGYVQRNLSNLRHKRPIAQVNRDELKPMVVKKANKELLEHHKKRQVELLCLTLEEKLKARK